MLKNIDENQKAKIWEEIIKEAQEENLPPQEDEITIKIFSEQSGWNTNISYQFLEQGVRDGKYKKRYAKLGGHRTAIYSPNIH